MSSTIADRCSTLVGRTGGYMRAVAFMLLAGALLGPIAAADTKPGAVDLARPHAIAVDAAPIRAFERGGGSRTRFGSLEFRGGLTISSANRHFGGFSGLVLDRGGKRLLAVSDAGAWMTADLVYDGARLSGMRTVEIGPLAAVGGRLLTRSRDFDAEAVRLVSGTLDKGIALIAFEQNHRIGLFEVTRNGVAAPTSYLKPSPDWPRMTRNKSLESVAVIEGGPAKGAIVAFAERKIDPTGHHSGWIWPAGVASAPQRMALARGSGSFEITDVAALRDGALVILERSFAWTEGIKMRLRLIEASSVRAGTVLDGPVLFEADMGYDIDNMEGLAVHEAGGETLLTLISDDNFNRFLQRTILLQFALKREQVTARAR